MEQENTRQKHKEGSDMVQFTVNGMTMSTRLTKKFRERKTWTKPDEKRLVSFIPGTIRDIYVKEGDPVEENDRLLILEAMKMMNVITSPLAGTVSKIHVSSGDKVPKGKLMIEFK